MLRIFLYLLLSLSFSFSAISQRPVYSDNEIRYDENREQVRIIAASDDLLHVWKYGLSGISVSVYTQNLEYLSTKKLSSRPATLSFIQNSNFYYAVLSDSASTQIYSIENDGTFIDKTKMFEKQKLTLGVRHSYSFREGANIMFLLQQLNDNDQQKSFLYITALDTNLTYINKMVLEIEYMRNRPQNLILSPFGDYLLLLNHTISNGTESLAFTRVDVAKGTSFTKFFRPEGLRFISHQLLFYETEIILKSQVREQGPIEERPKSSSYFIRMNSDLLVLNSLYLNSTNPGQLQNSDYFYRPALTTVLPNKQILSIDFGRKENKKMSGGDATLRYVWVDSNLNIAKIVNQPTEEGKYFPTFTFSNDKGFHIYYEEMVRNKVNMINHYEIKDSIVNESALLLTPAYRYLLRRSIPVNKSSFVMPYIHNFHLGLVKINTENN